MFQSLDKLSDRHVLALILFVAVATSVASAVMHMTMGFGDGAEWMVGWLQNLGSEMLGAFATFWLIHLLVGGREEKGRLIRQMRIRDNALALQAVDELGAKGWLSDGSLDGATLMNANLLKVRLSDAQMKRVDLHGAILRGARMERVNLAGANLWGADLQDAGLKNVNLEGADLYQANLRGVKMIRVEMDEETRLPDGTKWTPNTDLGRFTESDAPNYAAAGKSR